MGWMLALAVFATCMCTGFYLMPKNTRERDRVAAKTEPVNGNDRPTDCRLFVQEVCAAVGRVFYFRIQSVTINSYLVDALSPVSLKGLHQG